MNRIAVLVLITMIASCRYKDGTLINFESPEGRLMGGWRLENAYKDGSQISIIKCNKDSLWHHLLTFTSLYEIQMGTEVIPYCDYEGNWKLTDKKRVIELTLGAQMIVEWKILRLTKKYRPKGNNGTDVQGDLWVSEKRSDGTYEFHFKSDLNFYK